MQHPWIVFSLIASSFLAAHAGEVFVEAESFKSAGGWEVVSGPTTRTASGVAVLNGSGGAKGLAMLG